jgi:sialate O-acetylesterase
MTDIPFATQRSDDWSLENVPLGVHKKEVTSKLTRQQKNKLIEALKQQDTERILHEAKTLQNGLFKGTEK